jgi:hypothetical protein
MNNRFIKTLVIVNGIFFPIFFAVIMFKLFSNEAVDSDYESEVIIVGDELEQARRDTLALQGLSYETPPRKIYNSTNMYIPISVLTYEEARKMRDVSERAGDFNPAWFNYFNVLFLDKEYNVIGQLLDKRATISEIFVNEGDHYYDGQRTIDKTVKNIAYRIGFDDTNKDGGINYLDDQDLYISDLNGQNLVQVTSKKNIVDFEFINSNMQIFIRYKERNDLRDEHNILKFGVFDIGTNTFKELKEIEKTLIDIESKLTR